MIRAYKTLKRALINAKDKVRKEYASIICSQMLSLASTLLNSESYTM